MKKKSTLEKFKNEDELSLTSDQKEDMSLVALFGERRNLQLVIEKLKSGFIYPGDC